MENIPTTASDFSFPYPEKHLLQVAVIAWVAVILGTVIPGLVAYKTDVFDRSTMTAKLRALPGTPRLEPIKEAIQEEDDLYLEIKSLDGQLAIAALNPTQAPDIQRLLSLRSAVQVQLDKLQLAHTISPLFMNDLMFAWSGMYTCFAVLFFVSSRIV